MGVTVRSTHTSRPFLWKYRFSIRNSAMSPALSRSICANPAGWSSGWLISRKLRPSSSSGEYPMMSQYRWLMRWMIPVWESTWATPTAAWLNKALKRSSLWRRALSEALAWTKAMVRWRTSMAVSNPSSTETMPPAAPATQGSRCSEGDSRDCVGRKVSRHRRLCTSSSLVKGRAPASASAVGASNERLVPSCAGTRTEPASSIATDSPCR